ncbi:MAG: siroheme synthase CysG [Steroidobacteraceae bacterium]
MDHLPIFLRIESRSAVVVGGGAVAARKAELLLACGARVTLVAPELSRPAAALLASATDRIEHLAAAFDPRQLAGAALAIAATDSPPVNASVAAAAAARHLPVNVADDAALSSFILPAVVDRSPVIVAIGTEGTAPVLARRLREQIEALLPARLGTLARFAGARRAAVRQALRPSERRPFWERFFGGGASAEVLAGREREADASFTRELAAAKSHDAPRGEVYLIGAGPGDPDLLTLKALQLLQQADVILYDRLVSREVLDRGRREAERIYVGKEAGEAGGGTSQQRIHELMVSRAEQGQRVARLKGGDPLVFGRAAEELRCLAERGIPFTVVPGITAGMAAAAAAAIPLTDRDRARSVTFVTGRPAAGEDLDWQTLARPGQTTIFYMGVATLERIASALTAAGAPLERPAALVERASLPEQRILRGSLGTIAALARAERVFSPALLIVGETAAAEAGTSAIATITQALRGVA